MEALRTILGLKLALLSMSLAPAISPSEAPRTFVRFDSGGKTGSIPIDLSGNGPPFVRGQLGRTTLWFLLDTASPSALSRKAAVQAGLEVETESSGVENVESGAARVGWLPKVTVRLQGADIDQRHVSSFDFDPLQAVLGHPVDGILGGSFFESLVVIVDYSIPALELYDPKSFSGSPKGREIPITLANGMPFVRASLKLPQREELEGEFLVHSGADAAVLLFSPFVKEHRLLDPSASEGAEAPLAEGRSLAAVLRAERMNIGPFTLSGPIAELSRSERGLKADRDHAGLFGSAILSRFRVTWDYSRRRMSLEKGARYAEPFPYDASGVSLSAQRPDLSTFEVRRVAPGSPAAEAHLAVGDVLLAVDGKPVKDITLPGVRRLFQEDGKEYLLSVLREGTVEKIRLKCRRML
jgi:hypothetical protein